MKACSAWVFPAFAMRHHEFRRDDISGYQDIVEELVERANGEVTINLEKFHAPDKIELEDDLEDTLQSQYACYIDGVALARFLQNHYPSCDYIAGYSMGLYAALCHSGVYTFEDGLRLMHQICVQAYQGMAPGEYGMGAVMGLTAEEVRQIADQTSGQIEISDILGSRSVIVSGERADVGAALEEFERSGAMSVKIIPVSLPFHSSRLRHMEPAVRDLVGNMKLQAPRIPVVSSITQDVLETEESVCDEIARNIGHPMNWHLTMRKLVDLGLKHLLECGLSENLTNIAKRNLRGKFTLHNYRDYGRAMASA